MFGKRMAEVVNILSFVAWVFERMGGCKMEDGCLFMETTHGIMVALRPQSQRVISNARQQT